MKVLVSDSSVLIEFSKRELLDKMFMLEFQFAVPDLLFHEELIDLGAYSRHDVLALGLKVESLDAEGVEILTEDRTMRSVAESKGVAHQDALWVIDNMLVAGIVSETQVVAVLEAMRDDPRCPIPNTDLSARIRDLGV